jgi:hypothetical protein
VDVHCDERFLFRGEAYQQQALAEAAHDLFILESHARQYRGKTAADWNWPSASWYLLDPPRQQLPGLPFIQGVPVGALDRS